MVLKETDYLIEKYLEHGLMGWLLKQVKEE